MIRRTQHWRSLFGGSLRSAGRAGSLGLLGLAMASCAAPGSAPPEPDTSHMSSGRLSVYGDDLMIQGRKLRDQGAATGDDDMKRRGEAMIAHGKQLVDRAESMADKPQ